MYIDVLDEYVLSTTQSDPTLLYPVPGDVSVDQDMQMRNSAFVKLKNCDVLDGSATSSAKIETKLVEHTSQVPN